GHAPQREPLRQIGQLLAQRRRGRVRSKARAQIDEDVAIPHLAAGAMQRIFFLSELRRHVRRAEQTAGEVVVPRVVRTLDAIDEVALRISTDSRAAMTADVEQRVNAAVLAARDDEAFGRNRTREVVARIRNLVGAPGADPAIEIEALKLHSIELG